MLVLVGEACYKIILWPSHEMNDYSEYHHLFYENTTNQFKTPEDNLHLLRWRDVCVWCHSGEQPWWKRGHQLSVILAQWCGGVVCVWCHSGELARWKRDQLSDIWHNVYVM